MDSGLSLNNLLESKDVQINDLKQKLSDYSASSLKRISELEGEIELLKKCEWYNEYFDRFCEVNHICDVDYPHVLEENKKLEGEIKELKDKNYQYSQEWRAQKDQAKMRGDALEKELAKTEKLEGELGTLKKENELLKSQDQKFVPKREYNKVLEENELLRKAIDSAITTLKKINEEQQTKKE